MKRFDVVHRKGISSNSLNHLQHTRKMMYDPELKVWYEKSGRPITYREKERVRAAREKTTRILNQFRSVFFSRPDALVIHLLYNTDCITMDHFKKWFNVYVDVNKMSLDGNNLIVPIHEVSMKMLRQRFLRPSISGVVRELLNYFNNDGMDEFFPTLWEFFALHTAADSEPEELQKLKAMENVRRMNARARQDKLEYDHKKFEAIQKSDYLAIRDTRIKSHVRVGRV